MPFKFYAIFRSDFNFAFDFFCRVPLVEASFDPKGSILADILIEVTIKVNSKHPLVYQFDGLKILVMKVLVHIHFQCFIEVS